MPSPWNANITKARHLQARAAILAALPFFGFSNLVAATHPRTPQAIQILAFVLSGYGARWNAFVGSANNWGAPSTSGTCSLFQSLPGIPLSGVNDPAINACVETFRTEPEGLQAFIRAVFGGGTQATATAFESALALGRVGDLAAMINVPPFAAHPSTADLLAAAQAVSLATGEPIQWSLAGTPAAPPVFPTLPGLPGGLPIPIPLPGLPGLPGTPPGVVLPDVPPTPPAPPAPPEGLSTNTKIAIGVGAGAAAIGLLALVLSGGK